MALKLMGSSVAIILIVCVYEIILLNDDILINLDSKKDTAFLNKIRKLSGICSQEERLKHIQEVCKRSPDILDFSNRYHLFNRDRNLAFCKIPKNGGTTWYKIMAISTDKGRKMTKAFRPFDSDDLKARDLIQNTKLNGFPNYHRIKKFVILRHPLARFLSAHNEKLFRNLTQPVKGDEKIRLEQRKAIAKILKKDRSFPYTVPVEDFVDIVTKENVSDELRDDIHWRRQHQICNLCSERCVAIFKEL